jgi:hypothetical protein
MINFSRTVNSFNMGWLLIHTESAAVWLHNSAHVTDRHLSGVYHTRNSSAGTAAPVTVEKVSILKYDPLSNDDSDDIAVARASL